ncbi:response regulator transcription factor [soil metagenome]
MIKIFIADDHAMMREGLKRIIASADEMMIVGEAVDGQDVLAKIDKTPCDVLMLDMTMPGMAGLELIQHVKKSRPELPIIVLSMHSVGKIAAAALKAGANGYLTKDSDPDRLVEVIRKIAGGGRYIDPAMVDKIVFDSEEEMQAHEYLSDRERQIFLMLVAGKTTNRIARELFLSAKTVSTHKKRILEKMKMDNSADLVRYAIEHNLAE